MAQIVPQQESSPLIQEHHRPLKNGDDSSCNNGHSPKDTPGWIDECTTTCRQRPMMMLLALVGSLIGLLILFQSNKHQQEQENFEQQHAVVTRIAFIGNSMFYFNDFPRFFQVFAAGGGGIRKSPSRSARSIYQNSCLHGGGSIPSLVTEGNSMYPQFATSPAIINDTTDTTTKHAYQQYQHNHTLYDFGSCTVEMLLTGGDPRLDDPGYAVPENKNSTNLNPCREDHVYLEYAKDYFADLMKVQSPSSPSFQWDFIIINDNTRNPSRFAPRATSLNYLEQFYVPWLLQQEVNQNAIPVFLWTQAYSVESTETRNMTGLEDVANFTSLTHVGYQEYAKMLDRYLPLHRKTRIAPVGLAFLWVYEERRDIWEQLFHSVDHIHASPSGTFLQGCIMYHTLFGKMPPKEWAVRSDMESFWATARMMQHAWEPPNPIPSTETAEYLYRVAERIMVDGAKPKSYIEYTNGEFAFDGSSS